tara:strand:+ start:89 stop:1204 length:1116 start_codon:yes stop_codon:yes gene_type:complete
MQAADKLSVLNWDDITLKSRAISHLRVEQAINSPSPTLDDFMAMIAPAGRKHLETMAVKAQAITRARFGHTISLFAPLYLSNLCANECTYCGFSMSNKLRRTTLDEQAVLAEIEVLKARGIDNILLVTGEHERKVGMAYFSAMLPVITPHFRHVAMEVQPLKTAEYLQLRQLGVSTVLVYQETYHRHRYAHYHKHGTKQDYDWRLHTPDRLGEAQMGKIGLGALLGLSDWRTDSVFTAAHALALQQAYWRSRLSISLPRIRPCAGQRDISQLRGPDDAELLQLICAYRLLLPAAEISLSTREPAAFRDNVAGIGVTTMSAGSQTEPGGYAAEHDALPQFDTEDNRSVSDIRHALSRRGLSAVMTDGLQAFA